MPGLAPHSGRTAPTDSRNGPRLVRLPERRLVMADSEGCARTRNLAVPARTG